MKRFLLLILAVALAGCGGTGSGSSAYVRGYNAVAGLDDGTITANGTTVLSDAGYRVDSTYYTSVTAKSSATITLTNTAGNTLATASQNLTAGLYYSFYAAGTTSSYSLLEVDDDRSDPGSGSARVRFIMLSPTYGNNVDWYITGTDTDISNTNARYSSRPFEDKTTADSFSSGTYKITVTAAGTKSILASQNITLSSNQISHVLFLDSSSGGTPRMIVQVVPSSS